MLTAREPMHYEKCMAPLFLSAGRILTLQFCLKRKSESYIIGEKKYL